MEGDKLLKATRRRKLRDRVVLTLLLGVPLIGLFLLNPALGAALSAAGTLVAVVLALTGGER